MAKDKRKNNGGHSTKSKSGIDKRKNQYRSALESAATVDDVESVIRKVLEKAKGGDMVAAKLFLEYYLGKPDQTINQNNSHSFADDFDITKIYSEQNTKT